jgi:hypothetical protein
MRDGRRLTAINGERVHPVASRHQYLSGFEQAAACWARNARPVLDGCMIDRPDGPQLSR